MERVVVTKWSLFFVVCCNIFLFPEAVRSFFSFSCCGFLVCSFSCCSAIGPIDVVYTWVNGSDPELLRTLQDYKLLLLKKLREATYVS